MNLAQQRLLITGGAGFVGSHMCDILRERGHQIATVPPMGEYKEWDQQANVLIPLHRDWDLTQETSIRFLLDVYQPTVIIHLAALCGGIGLNRAKPGELYYKNLVMGAHLMECARRAGIKKFVAVGTVCAYPKYTPVPFQEDELWQGYPEETNAPYGLAKKMMLVQAQAYRQQYGFNAIYLLPVNLYGPRDNFDPKSSHVIPALIQKALFAKEQQAPEIEVWGTGSASREFLYVRDAAEAILLATEHYDKSEPVNVGAGVEITIKSLVEMICYIVGYEGKIKWDSSKPDGQPRRKLSTSKAEQEFGFKSSTPFSAGLRNTIEWYNNERRHHDDSNTAA